MAELDIQPLPVKLTVKDGRRKALGVLKGYNNAEIDRRAERVIFVIESGLEELAKEPIEAQLEKLDALAEANEAIAEIRDQFQEKGLVGMLCGKQAQYDVLHDIAGLTVSDKDYNLLLEGKHPDYPGVTIEPEKRERAGGKSKPAKLSF